MNLSESTKKTKAISIVFLIISISIPCYLASQRDLSIGGDTKGYIYGMYNLAETNKVSLLEYFEIAPPWYAIPRTIIGYMFLNWGCAQFENGFQILLFMIDLLAILPVYLAIKKVSKSRYETVFGYTLFLLFFFNISLNAARQSIGLAFYLLAYVYMTQREYKKTFLFTLVGFLFHDTAIIILPVALIHYVIVDRVKSQKKQRRYEGVIVLLSIIAVLGFYPLLNFLVNTGIYSHGAVYLTLRRFDFSFIKTALYLSVYLIVILNKKYMVQSKEDEFYKFISLLSVIWLQAGALITYADRLSWYLFYPIILVYLPKIAYRRNGKISTQRWLYAVAVILIFLAYWVILYGIINEHGTVPYISYNG